MRSNLGDYAGDLDPVWLLPAVSVDEFFACDFRHTLIRAQPDKRSELEAGMAADRAVVEAAMQPGDELRPWRHLLNPSGPSGQLGVAVVRAGRVVKAWWTAILC